MNIISTLLDYISKKRICTLALFVESVFQEVTLTHKRNCIVLEEKYMEVSKFYTKTFGTWRYQILY